MRFNTSTCAAAIAMTVPAFTAGECVSQHLLTTNVFSVSAIDGYETIQKEESLMT